MDHAPLTLEGNRLWAALRAPASWVHTGLGPARLDRAEVARRVAGEVDLWAFDPLVDAFDDAATAARAKTETKPAAQTEGGQDGG